MNRLCAAGKVCAKRLDGSSAIAIDASARTIVHACLDGAALVTRIPRAAAFAFEEVTQLGSQLEEAWIFLVRVHLTQQDLAAAEFARKKALALNP